MRVTATRRHLRCSAQKARLVVDQIRGRGVEECIAELKFSPKRVAKDVSALIQSAVANARENHEHEDVASLVVESAWVDMGPTWKRIRPRDRGMANRIRKRTCHITVQVWDGVDEHHHEEDYE